MVRRLDDGGFWHWLAGFTDGEGTFGIVAGGRAKGSHRPTFAITLRADDRPMLEEIRVRLGSGSIYTKGVAGKLPRGNRKPQVVLHVIDKPGLLRLVAVFDEHPLRAKKARDYAIWREAVLLWALREGHRGGEKRSKHPVQDRLARLKVELVTVRRWKDRA